MGGGGDARELRCKLLAAVPSSRTSLWLSPSEHILRRVFCVGGSSAAPAVCSALSEVSRPLSARLAQSWRASADSSARRAAALACASAAAAKAAGDGPTASTLLPLGSLLL